jgi:hypothetical protein
MLRSNGGCLSQSSIKRALAISLSLFFLSCQRAPTTWEPGQAFVTQVVVGSSQGSQLQTVQLEGVMDSKTLRGRIVEFTLAPGERQGADGTKQLMGQSPVARFIQSKDGVNIPADVLTLQMTTLYFHMQSLKKLENKIVEEKNLVNWPRRVGLRANAKDPNNRFNNAFYNADLDVLYFVPYVETQLPVPLNSGVIGHEHFHAYFSEHVLKKLKIDKDDIYSEYVLKSLNEGLADVWGWLYSGEPDFVALSLPMLSNRRTLEKPTDSSLEIKSEARLRSQAHSAQQICPNVVGCKNAGQLTTDEAYENGTVLARLFRYLMISRQQKSNLSFEDMRVQMGQKLLMLLAKIQKSAEAEELNLEEAVVQWTKLMDVQNKEECDFVKDALSTLKYIDQVCLKQK